MLKTKKIILYDNKLIEHYDANVYIEHKISISVLNTLKSVIENSILLNNNIENFLIIEDPEDQEFYDKEFNIATETFIGSKTETTSILMVNKFSLVKIFDYILDNKINYLVNHFIVNLINHFEPNSISIRADNFYDKDDIECLEKNSFEKNIKTIKSDKFHASISKIMDNLDFINVRYNLLFNHLEFLKRQEIDIRKLSYKDSIPFIKLHNRMQANNSYYLDNNFEDRLPIVMVTDINQVFYCINNIESIAKQSKEKVKFYLVLVDVKDKIEKKITRIIKKFEDKADIFIKSVQMGDFKVNVSKLKNITPTTNVMLYLPDIIFEEDRIFYIDTDTVVMGDINELNNYFDKDTLYVRQTHDTGRWLKKLSSFYLYHSNLYSTHNAGVAHMPLKKMRELGYVKSAEYYFFRNHKDIKLADQDILDATWPIQDLKWNLNIARSIWPQNYRWLNNFDSVRIYHFINRNKQWSKINFKNPKIQNGSLTKHEMIGHRKAYNFWNGLTDASSHKKMINLYSFEGIDLNSLFYWNNLQFEFDDFLNITLYIDNKIWENKTMMNYILNKGLLIEVRSIDHLNDINNDNRAFFNLSINTRLNKRKLFKYKNNERKLI